MPKLELMDHLRYLALLMSLAFCTVVQSQITNNKSFELEWTTSKTIYARNDRSVSGMMLKEQALSQDGLPHFSTQFILQNNETLLDYQIINVKFSPIKSGSFQQEQLMSLTNELQAEVESVKMKDRNLLVISMTPLVKRNGQLMKVNSFDLSYRLDTKKDLLKTGPPTYPNSSLLSSGTWYKFSIDSSGVYKLDAGFLRNLGINSNQIDPNNIRIAGNGGQMLAQSNAAYRPGALTEIAITVQDGGDGSFDDEDSVLFYGLGPHSWNIDRQNPMNSRHQTNLYSDQSYYFISVDSGPGKRINSQDTSDENPTNQINSYHDFVFHELEEVNLFANGQQWLGEDFSFNSQQQIPIDWQNFIPGSQVGIRVRGAAISFSQTQMDISVNGLALTTLDFDALSNNSFTLATTDEKFALQVINSESLLFDINYNNGGNPSSRAYLDYIEVLGEKRLENKGEQFQFRNLDAVNGNEWYEFEMINSDPDAILWDLSDHLHPVQIPLTHAGNTSVFNATGGDKEYLLFSNRDLFVPSTIEDPRVANQDLLKDRNIEYLVIAPEYLISEAQRLSDYHRNNSDYQSRTVALEQIYNEFSSGSPDLTAIRDYIRFLYLNAGSDAGKPKFICLFGDASFDFKDRLSDNTNIVPAFQSYESFNLVTSYVTDDYYGMMDENEGELKPTDRQDIATGRFPVTNLMEARDLVDKTLTYYDASALGDWRNTISFVADDPDHPSEFVLQQAVDDLAEELQENVPEFNLKKIYADAHEQISSSGGERYPTVNQSIDNSVETGTLIVDYFGHGGVNGWANERILEVPQIQEWSNSLQLPLFITVTCEFARYDNPIRPTAGEYSLWNNEGGAVSLISTTREIFISVGQLFNRTLFLELFSSDTDDSSIAQALMRTKGQFSTDQRYFVQFFGDPAMRLVHPAPGIQLTKINGTEIGKSNDTIKALSKIQLEGIVKGSNGAMNPDFNGTLTATVYDKALSKTTLDNDGFGKKMEFKALESKIFRGRASVNNGEFTFEFIVPKDIRIAYGEAKVSLYAQNLNTDLSGSEQKLIIGGIDQNAEQDETGPTIQLFMNDESFVDGGNTSESPVLLALLEDLSGINTSITSVDHDIIVILDGDQANPYVLNDYYETELNDFTKGKVKFPFKNLEPGLHTLQFKCWDTHNNPSESTLTFQVVNDNDLILSNVLNYPNPFVNYTEFWFNHNKPNEPLEVQVQIFTISGKLIRTLHRSVQSDGLLSREISWNGLDDFGNKIGKGVYVYKLHVRSEISKSSAEIFEKLVILQ